MKLQNCCLNFLADCSVLALAVPAVQLHLKHIKQITDSTQHTPLLVPQTDYWLLLWTWPDKTYMYVTYLH